MFYVRSVLTQTPILDPDAAKALGLRQIAYLDDLLEAGMSQVRALKVQAETQMAQDPGYWINGKREQAYDRLSRSVRYSIVLQTRIANGELWAAPPPPEPAARIERQRPTSDAAQESVEAREAREPAERLADPVERERPEDYRRPIGEMVQIICDGLGVTPDGSLRADADPEPAPAPTPAPSKSPIVDTWIRNNLPQHLWPHDLKPGDLKPNGHDPP
jgi:hypothetical protein